MYLYIQLVCHKFVFNIVALFTDAQNALSGEDNSIACRLLENKLRSKPTKKKIGPKTFHHFDILRIYIGVRCSAIHRTLPPLPHRT